MMIEKNRETMAACPSFEVWEKRYLRRKDTGKYRQAYDEVNNLKRKRRTKAEIEADNVETTTEL